MGNIRGGMNGFLGTVGQPTAQVIDGSLMFNGVNQHLTRTFSSGGNRRTFTLSYWIKEHGQKGTSPTNNPHVLWSGTSVETRGGMVHRGTGSGDAGRIYMFNQVSNTTNSAVWTNSMHRDFSGWKHVVFEVDSTQGTGTNRVKIYINGVEQDDEYKTTPSQNLDFQINVAQEHRIGRGTPDDYGNFSLSQYYFIDGQALDASYFGFTDPLTNTWRPKKYTGTYGTTGFWLPMDNQDNFEKDRSGNGNHWTKNNFSGTFNNPNVLKDSPSGAVFGGRAQTGITTTSSAAANYCTFNPLDSNQTHSNGNLSVVCDGGTSPRAGTGSISVSIGKYYWEVTLTAQTNQKGIIGVVEDNYDGNGSTIPNGSPNGVFYFGEAGNKIIDNTSTSYGASYTVNDVIGVALNLDDGDITFYKNGSSQGKITTKTFTGAYKLATGHGSSSGSSTYALNTGQKPFKYAPPQGFLPLNSATARPNTVVPRPDQYVGVTTYVGNGGTQSINTLMDPDLVWIKNRDESVSHFLYDSVRGANKYLRSDGNFAEDTGSSNELSFIHNGFTVNGAGGGVNKNNIDFVSWSWKAGGNKNTFNVDGVGYATFAASGTTAGTITPTGTSIGTKQGFSIIKYTGTGSAATLPHGLTQAPEFVLVKNLDSTYNWAVYHKDLTSAAYYLFLNNSDGQSNNFYTFWNSTDPSSTVISLGADSSDSNVNTNKASQSHICYAWHSVPGLQKFGTYVGNGNSDGSYIELGFRPSLVIIKNLEGQNWILHDSVREPFNPVSLQLYPSITNAEYDFSGNAKDLLSNGFKLRGTNAGTNDSDGTTKYVYMAWAEAPAFNLFGGQSNAR